jgi:hypothetical protein
MPSTSRCPLSFTAVATTAQTLTMRPASQLRWVSASIQT